MVFKKCPNCEGENPDSAEFCLECGAKMDSEKEDSPPSPAYAVEPEESPLPEPAPGLPEKPPEPPAPRSLFSERYNVIEIIGVGRLGTVYKVFDKALDRELALKAFGPEIAKNAEAFEGFSRELRAERGIVHKNIARLFELSTEKGSPFLTMEFVPGQNLRALLLEKRGQLPVDQAVSLAKQLSKALAEVHRQGVLHLDLRPSNIIIDKEGTPKIIDLGVAQWLRSKGLIGAEADPEAVRYQSPEQVEGRIADPRSDIYSLGVILYELVTGDFPFAAETPAANGGTPQRQAPRNPRDLNPTIRPELALLILRCLDTERENRYQSARDLSVDLEKIEDGVKPEEGQAQAAAKPAPSRPAAVQETSAPPEAASPRIESGPSRRKPRPAFRMPEIPRNFMLWGIIAVAAIVLGLAVWRLAFHGGRAAPQSLRPQKKVLAVLPFEDESDAKGRGYFGEGMSEALIGALIRLPDLSVPGASSAVIARAKSADGHQAAQALGADYVLTGGFAPADRGLRVSARVVRLADGVKLWENQFERNAEDLWGALQAVVDGTAGALKVNVPTDKKNSLVQSRLATPEALDLYFHARSLASRGGKDNLEKAEDLFQKAVDKDPGWGAAWAGLANACIALGAASNWSPDAAFPRARQAILKALELEPYLAETRMALALLKWRSEWDFEGAENEFKQALRSSPEQPEVRLNYALFLSSLGRHEEALSQMRIAQALDPLSPKTNAGLGTVLYYARLYDQAAEELAKARDTNPSDFEACYDLGLLYIQTKEFGQSLQMFRQAAVFGGDQGEILLHIGSVLAHMGARQDVGKILTEALRAPRGTYVSSVSLGSVYAALLEKEQVQACLEKALEEKDASLVFLRVSPLFDAVRSERWFAGLLQKIGL
jgi:serine/threonine protein kinase/TolB-like protein/Tfp pilus assembly protein PilF